MCAGYVDCMYIIVRFQTFSSTKVPYSYAAISGGTEDFLRVLNQLTTFYTFCMTLKYPNSYCG
uniref:Uncharacterized protein n=1 Tax=Arion vulgaris TaxID=1028688 RepID=A0A0B7A9F2_9EUPU